MVIGVLFGCDALVSSIPDRTWMDLWLYRNVNRRDLILALGFIISARPWRLQILPLPHS